MLTLPHQPPPPFPAPPCCSAPRERAVDLLKRAREGDAPRCGGGGGPSPPCRVMCHVVYTPRPDFGISQTRGERPPRRHPVAHPLAHPRAPERAPPWPGRFVTGWAAPLQRRHPCSLARRSAPFTSSLATLALPLAPRAPPRAIPVVPSFSHFGPFWTLGPYPARRCHQQAPQRLLPGRVELIRSSNHRRPALQPPAARPAAFAGGSPPRAFRGSPCARPLQKGALLPSRVLFCALQRTRGDPSGDAPRCGGPPPHPLATPTPPAPVMCQLVYTARPHFGILGNAWGLTTPSPPCRPPARSPSRFGGGLPLTTPTPLAPVMCQLVYTPRPHFGILGNA